MKLKLYTIENKSGHIGPIAYNWMTKKEIVEVWKERKNKFQKVDRLFYR